MLNISFKQLSQLGFVKQLEFSQQKRLFSYQVYRKDVGTALL
jgi:hypothetical protein